MYPAVTKERTEELNLTLEELKIGTWTNLVTAKRSDALISILEKFINDRVSAVPILDEDDHVINVYEKYDLLVCLADAVACKGRIL